jgi:hypothetical protein
MPMTDDGALARTLGQRLDAIGRDIAGRHLVGYPWADRLAPLLGRAAQLTELFQDRFERDESPAVRTLVSTHRAAGRGAGPAPAGGHPAASAAAAGPAEPARPLPPGVRSQLRDVAGPGADALRVHTGTNSDAVARSYGADAVTQGTDVYLRAGRFGPDEPDGLGLLAHEAAHVTALLDPGLAARRAAAPGAEEDAALSSERAARALLGPARPGQPAVGQEAPRLVPGPTAGPPRAGSTAGPPLPAQAGAGPATAAASAQPMPAAADRDTGQSAPFDIEELRRGMITELMRQLRTEFERGG